MKKIKLTVAALLVSVIVMGQSVKFTTSPNWADVLSEAKKYNKFIFIDGYATWCKPCKIMDQEAFGDSKVGSLLNSKFISVKIQTDRTFTDSDYIKSWYEDSANLQKKYNFSTLPAQIILSPTGELLFQHSGYNGVDNFIRMIKFAIDSNANNFRQQLAEYEMGRKDYNRLPQLILSIKNNLKDRELIRRMARDYFDNYLIKKTKLSDILNTDSRLVVQCDLGSIKPTDKFIATLRKIPYKTADSLLDFFSGTSLRLVQQSIQNVELEEKLWKDGTPVSKDPNFKMLKDIIQKKYPEMDAKQIVFEYQKGGAIEAGFYRRVGNIKMMNNVIGMDIKRMLAKGICDGPNNWCWFTYFCNVNDKDALKLAIHWMDQATDCAIYPNELTIDDRANLYDTKAALYYKLGQRKAAIETLEEGIRLLQVHNSIKGLDKDRGCEKYYNVIQQMKKGIKIGEPDANYPREWALLD